ncbi:radical SAM protein [Candidatus Woesearchaeota archaeon]|nr:radical SAM protein [Candidatus Woesearchaeota archaeon]
MDNEYYKLDKGRVVVSTGGTCPLRCKYCYTYSDDFKAFPRNSPDKVVSDLRTFANRIDLVQLGYDTELFLRQKEAISLIEGVEDIGKDISFATKMHLSDQTIDSLSATNKRMRKALYPLPGTENYLTAFVSLIGFETARMLEPKAPSSENRIMTIKRLHDAGIPTYVFIRPLLPLVSDGELERLFDETRDFCDGYVIGKLYCDQEMMSSLGISQTSGKRRMVWGLDQRTWDVVIDDRISALSNGKTVFDSSLQAVNAVRKNGYQEAIIEGMLASPGTDMLDTNFYSTRLSVPDNINHIIIPDRTADRAPGLTLIKNIFTGDFFNIPSIYDFDAIRRFYEGNVLAIDQPPNVCVSSPRTMLLEDGRLFANSDFIANFDLTEAVTQSLLKGLENALLNKESFIRVCEGLEERICTARIDEKTFWKVKKSTTVR